MMTKRILNQPFSHSPYLILRRLLVAIIPLLLLAFLLQDTIIIKAGSINDRIQDRAGLLTYEEKQSLEDLIGDNESKVDIDIFILTHNDSSSTYPEEYIEDVADLLVSGNQVFFLYDLYRGEIFMEGYGTAETYIHSKRIDDIMDHMVDDIKSENYYSAFVTYIDMVTNYMLNDSELNTDYNYIYDTPPAGTNPSSNSSSSNSSNSNVNNYNYSQYYTKPQEESIFHNVLFQVIVSLVLGVLVIVIMVGRSSSKMTVRGENYAVDNQKGLIGRRDQYIRTSVTRIRRPQNNTNNTGGKRPGSGFNSGGFRGGVSAGGRSHSSGGRKL